VYRCYRTLALVTPLLLTPALTAQVASPHVGYVYPAGGRQGTTVEVRLGGQFFTDANAVQVSGTGVTAKVLRQTKPLTQGEINALRDKLQELNKKTEKTPDDMKEIAGIKEKLSQAAITVSPVLAENVFVEVTIADDAYPGPRELRLGAKTGWSNPVVFDVGQLPEVRQEKESFDPEARPRPALARFAKPRHFTPETEIKVTLPAVLNSQLMPGEVDSYRFTAKKGQHLVFRTRARALMPYLADAVPGWIQSVLTLYDADGTEVAFSGEFANRPDPVLTYEVPRDGEYMLEIHDALYRGREDFVYRIEAGELPHIMSVFPLGGQANVKTTVTLEGWNLPARSLVVEAKDMKPGLLPLSVEANCLRSNAVPFQAGTLPEIAAQEPNHTIAEAQKITLPVVINGRIGKRGEWDVYRFEGRARQEVVAEVWARRLDSPLDSFLKLTDADGKVLAFNDDHEDRAQGLITHHADSLIRTTLPKDGTYYLHVGDAQRHGGPAYAYRLRVSEPRPDFELRVTPCSINARPGATAPVTVHAIRRDGFTGPINVSFKYAPVDFGLAGAQIPADQDEVRMTVLVPSTARPAPIQLDMEGKATIGGRQVTRPVVPAEDMMQAFAYHHLVPADHLLVTVSKDARARFPARLLNNQVVRIRPGGTALVYFAVASGEASDKFQVLLNEPPEGITLKKATFQKGGAVLELHADAEKVKAGLRTNVIAEVYPSSGSSGKPSRFPLGTFPAIPIEITGN